MTVVASQLVHQRVFQQRRQQELSGDASDYKRMWQVRAAGLLGAASVGAGAYGAHGLVSHDDEYRAIWKTAVQYHQVHALALLATAVPRDALWCISMADFTAVWPKFSESMRSLPPRSVLPPHRLGDAVGERVSQEAP